MVIIVIIIITIIIVIIIRLGSQLIIQHLTNFRYLKYCLGLRDFLG